MGLIRAAITVVSLFVSSIAFAAPPRTLVFEPPSSIELDALQATGPRLVYLNFDGVTLTGSGTVDNASTNTSMIPVLAGVISAGQTVTVPVFQPAQLGNAGGLTRAEIITYVLSEMVRIHAPYDLHFVTERPASAPYSTVIIGGSCPEIVGQNCAGVALLDCNDNNPNNVSFAFPPGIDVQDLVVVISQEMAHAFGLNHTTDSSDIMFPQLQLTSPDSYGEGPIPSGEPVCGGASFQNSHQKLLDIVGPAGAPAVEITSPADETLVSGIVTVIAAVEDDNALASVELLINGGVVATDDAAPFELAFDADSLAAAAHDVVVRATDDDGNVGSDAITLHTGECRDDTDCADELVCESHLCVVDPGPNALGSVCTADEDCMSLECATIGEHTLCTQACVSAADCPGGFECRAEGLCWPNFPGGGGDDGSGGSGDGGDGGNGGNGADDDGDDSGDNAPAGCASTTAPGATPSAGALLLIALLIAAHRLRRQPVRAARRRQRRTR